MSCKHNNLINIDWIWRKLSGIGSFYRIRLDPIELADLGKTLNWISKMQNLDENITHELRGI